MDEEQVPIPDNSKGDEDLLQEIRDNYAYASEKWREIQDERRIDMRYISGDPWDDEDRKARKSAGRPCINHDELNQYVNHAINNARQNKRGIKVDPMSNATEKDSELRQDIIRTAEYRSRAQAAYLSAYQSMLEGSYGFFGISRRYVENENLTAENFEHQEITFRTFMNPDCVLPYPDCKEPDWSDQEFCFVLDPLARAEFKRKYKNAQLTDFSVEQQQAAKDWINDKTVLVAEYWKRITTEETVYLVGGEIVTALPKGAKARAQRTRIKRQVIQYITNGVQILKRNPQPGTIIPIIPVTGLERYIDDGSGPKRKLFSLPRLAREPQLSLAFLVSQQMEEAGLTPKTPYIGYTGQFDSDAEGWENITKVPRAFLRVDVIADGSGNPLPLPERPQFTPNFQQYEIAKDSARRAIQAAMGISPLPTAAQRNNEKSGVALEKIEQAQDVGSFHFVDNFDRALMLAGRVINEWIPPVYGSSEREMMLLRPDETHRRVKLNTEEPYVDEKTKEMVHYPIDDGSHTVTVSTGPSYDSQRQEVSSFVDTLIENLGNLPVAPPVKAKILSIAIQMKQLGPKGDQLAELIAPPDPNGMQPEAQAAIAQAQGMIQTLQGELQKLLQEREGKVLDNQLRLQVERLKADSDYALKKLQIEADIAKAEIATKSQSIEERLQFVEDAWKQLHGQAHDAALQAADQTHERQMAAEQQQAAQQQQAAEEQPSAAEPQPQAA